MAIDKIINRAATITVDAASVSDSDNTSTGAFDMPTGTTAQRPGSANSGQTRFNSTTGSLEFYDGNAWVSTNLIPTITSITGNINNTYATNLVFAVANNTDTVDVVFSEGGSAFHTVTGQAVSSGAFTLAVPAAVYGQTAGDTIVISIKNADGTPSSNTISKTVLAAPSGGTITTSGNFRIHTFTSSGTFNAGGLNITNAEYLVIAGGAGGGSDLGGGGGAGGYRSSVVGQSSGGGGSAEARISLSGSTSVTVGAGGAGGAAVARSNAATHGQAGNDSVFGSITSIKGGGGGAYATDGDTLRDGVSGGSGGGGASGSATDIGQGASGTTNQGYAGGNGKAGGPYAAGGGGGAGAVGDAAPSNGNKGGDGGDGVSSNITGSAVTRAGGGGGSNYHTPGGGVGGTGGTGGGGDGAVNQGTGAANIGDDATVNTGSGGGGGTWTGSGPQLGGAGGSGIVIVRYDMTVN